MEKLGDGNVATGQQTEAAICVGFIEASRQWFIGMTVLLGVVDEKACDDTLGRSSLAAITRVFQNWAEDNPARWTDTSAVVLMSVIQENWPACKFSSD
jgi:hypothetical protein